jgi:2-keto-4-pentenoate hydratase
MPIVAQMVGQTQLQPFMTTHSDAALAAARIFVARRQTGQAGPLLPEALRPADLIQALAIQAAVTDLLGDTVAGWKCGTPAPGKVVLAPIFASTVYRSQPCLAWAKDGAVEVEPELAFVLGHDLPVRPQPYEPAEVDAAIAHTHLALELLGRRFSAGCEPDFAEKLADGLVNQGLFLGPAVDASQAARSHEMPIVVSVDGVAQPALEGRHPDALPRAPLYWLAEYLRAVGVGLQAGQVVITGSYAGCLALPVGREVVLRFGELGELAVQFGARAAAGS